MDSWFGLTTQWIETMVLTANVYGGVPSKLCFFTQKSYMIGIIVWVLYAVDVYHSKCMLDVLIQIDR